MSNTPHTLGDEFPDQMDAIHALKAKSPEFAHVLTEYDAVNDKFIGPRHVSTPFPKQPRPICAASG